VRPVGAGWQYLKSGVHRAHLNKLNNPQKFPRRSIAERRSWLALGLSGKPVGAIYLDTKGNE